MSFAMAKIELAGSRRFLSPQYRYRHAGLIHAARVGLSVLSSILLTSALHLPHGEWTSITVLAVVGGLQHHGNIRRKAAERSLGTLFGAAFGLLVVLQQSFLGAPIVTYFILAAACGFCAYHAIGKGGYTALLSAVTIVIVVGHGANTLGDGLWRVIDILLGAAIALAFSFALPLYATWSWRYGLADALRGCASIYAATAGDVHSSGAPEPQTIAAVSARLVDLRPLMPSVSKEAAIPLEKMEEIQRSLRICISALDLMAGVKNRVASENRAESRRVILPLLGMGRALKFGKLQYLSRPMDAPPLPANPDGYALLNQQLNAEVENLRRLLAETAGKWNI
jgi:uncharacterized membrane protein YccC